MATSALRAKRARVKQSKCERTAATLSHHDMWVVYLNSRTSRSLIDKLSFAKAAPRPGEYQGMRHALQAEPATLQLSLTARFPKNHEAMHLQIH